MAADVNAMTDAANQLDGSSDFIGIVVLLAAAVIAVPLFRRAGLGSVIGYLAAGLVIGPFGLGLFNDPQSVIHVAELGVVLFLFIIGLEMHPSRLWAMRGEIFGLGMLQVGMAMAALSWVGVALGFPLALSFVAGTGFVLTSTAIVMQMLDERGQTDLPKGRRIVAIMLMEDMAIVPLLALVAFLAPGGVETSLADRAVAVAIGLAAIATLVVAGRYLLNPLFYLLARSGAREVMTAAALLVVLGAGLLMQAGGLSMAMGAFLAGVLLSESSFRHQLEADIEPFRGLLLGLFFLGVGMALDLDVIARNWWLVAVCVPSYMFLKMLVVYIVARITRADRNEALERATLMSQGGEFAFVLYATAASVGIIDAKGNAILSAIIIVSMALTPLLVLLNDRFGPKARVSMDGVDEAHDLCASVLLVGFGRVGQIVSQPLLARGHSISIIETDPEMIRDVMEFGFKVWYGDGTRLDILRAAGAAEASVIIVAVDDQKAATKIVELAKAEFPLVPVIARAYDRTHAIDLVKLGVDHQVRETFESALLIGREALTRLGDTAEEADEVIVSIRERDGQRFEMDVVDGLRAGITMLFGNADQRKR